MLAATLAASLDGMPDQRVELRVADEIQTALRGDRGRVLARWVAPDQLSVARIEPESAAGQRREVDDPVDHARGAGDLAAGVEPPANIPRRGVERVEGAVIGADQDVPAPDGGRAVDEVAGPVRPAELAGGCAEGVHLSVGRADVDAAVGDRGIGVERAGAADPWLRGRAPDLLAGVQVERVDVGVVGAEVDAIPRLRDRPLDQPPRLEVPAQV